MNGSARWRTLMEYLNENPDCTKEEIIEMISMIKGGIKNRKHKDIYLT